MNPYEDKFSYRMALSDHVWDKDKIESWEIRTGHGWDKFTELEKSVFLLKSLMKGGEK